VRLTSPAICSSGNGITDADLERLAVSTGQVRLVSGGGDSKVCVWEPESGALLFRLEGHTSAVPKLAIYYTLVDYSPRVRRDRLLRPAPCELAADELSECVRHQ
jgi:WD40 repeat protein